MTDRERLEAELAEVDRQLDELWSRDSGFDLAREIRRIRSSLFDREGNRSYDAIGRFESKHDRAERIKELQRRREELLVELAELEGVETSRVEYRDE